METVETLEGLRALPAGTVLLSRDETPRPLLGGAIGEVFQVVTFGDDSLDPGAEGTLSGWISLEEIWLPAWVLHRPDKPPADRPFTDWAAEGIRRGWTTPTVCATHAGVPATLEEQAQEDKGGDPCIHIIRLAESEEDQAALRDAHPELPWPAKEDGQ